MGKTFGKKVFQQFKWPMELWVIYHQALFLNPPRVSPQHSSHQSPQALACGVTSAVYTGPLSGAVIRAARDLTTSLVACMFPFLTIFLKLLSEIHHDL